MKTTVRERQLLLEEVMNKIKSAIDKKNEGKRDIVIENDTILHDKVWNLFQEIDCKTKQVDEINDEINNIRNILEKEYNIERPYRFNIKKYEQEIRNQVSGIIPYPKKEDIEKELELALFKNEKSKLYSLTSLIVTKYSK